MWSDRETEQDCLGYSSYVDVLANICTHKDLAPLTLGVFGSWGSGKTSLMRMLKTRLDTTSKQTGTKTMWFNAWKYEGREEAQSALIHAIIAKLEEDKTLVQTALEAGRRLKSGAGILKLAKAVGKSLLTMTPDFDGFVDSFSKESEKLAQTIEQFDADFEQLLSSANIGRVVVFIDDLDRCSSAKVIDTFETIKLFLNTPSCTFVIGADAERIQDAVGEVYTVADKQRRKDYLEKIVQIPFSIPQQSVDDITCYVGMLIIGRHISSPAWEHLSAERSSFYDASLKMCDALCRWPERNHVHFSDAKAVASELEEVLPYVITLARGLKGNPRQIKRFLNILALRRQMAKANNLGVTPGLLIKIGVLEYAWQDFFDSVADTVDPATGHSALLDEIAKAAKDHKSDTLESKLLAESMGKAGLVEYLMAAPALDGTIDLRDYLFLAQTSLSRGQVLAVMPADEKAESLARAIEGDDALRAKAAAQQAAAQEPAIASAIVRRLVSDLQGAKEAISKVRIIGGLDILCRKHCDPVVLKVLPQIDPTGNDALALTGITFLRSAQSAGVEIPEGIIDRYEKASPLAEAFSGSRRNSRKQER